MTSSRTEQACDVDTQYWIDTRAAEACAEDSWIGGGQLAVAMGERETAAPGQDESQMDNDHSAASAAVCARFELAIESDAPAYGCSRSSSSGSDHKLR